MSLLKSSTFIRPIGYGLLVSQCISTLHIYLSNKQIFEFIHTSPLINQQAIHALLLPSHAFFGGLFFTLTVGLFMCFFCLWLCYLRHRYQWSKKMSVAIVIVWLFCLVFFTSAQIFSFMGAYIFFIPAVIVLTFRYEKIALLVRYPLFASVFTLMLAVQNYSFIDVRDYLLLSNPIGSQMNDFYYKYTFYPAEIIKPANKKLFKIDPDLGLKKDPYRHFRMLILLSLMLNLGFILFLLYVVLFSVSPNKHVVLKMGMIGLMLAMMPLLHIEKPDLAKRYWQIQSRDNKQPLGELLQDKQVNIVCMALQGMGKSRDIAFIPAILEIIKTSNHWYIQLYAHHALRRLSL